MFELVFCNKHVSGRFETLDDGGGDASADVVPGPYGARGTGGCVFAWEDPDFHEKS